ncbi:hypothetical protein KHP62_12090 [Rhodobacteraceae bacterium NNCM2]|nr:hypothetical protein [Coraliihabitans acroporae]
MNEFAEKHGAKVIWAFSLLLLVGAFLVSCGAYNIDEAVYLAGAGAVGDRGSLIVENGYDRFQTDGLRLWFFVAGPNGLTPQYPAGTAIIGGLLDPLFGNRGLILMSALCAIATLFVTHALARDVSGRADVALLSVVLLFAGSFWIEYALAIWPHASSVLIVTLVTFCTLRALPETKHDILWAAAAGLAAGGGLLIRTDTVLIFPAMGVAFLLFADRPMRVCIGAAIGLLPGALTTSLINHFKFGTFNPISYGGHDSGGINLSSHIGSIAALAVVFVLLLVLRRVRFTPRLKVMLGIVAALGIAVAFFVPALAKFLTAYVTGAYALVVDSRTIVDPRPGVVDDGSGVVIFWGLAKKALGQSLPWMGLLLLLAVRPWPERSRSAIWIFLVAMGAWSLPFFMLSWHGGLGNNMRYLLPLVPMIAILCAMLWVDLTSITGGTSRFAAIGRAAGLLIVVTWVLFGPNGLDGVQQLGATILLIAVAAAALLVGLRGRLRTTAAHAAQGLAAAGFTFAVIFGITDLLFTQTKRTHLATLGTDLSALPERSVVIGLPEVFLFQFDRPEGILYMPDRVTGQIDVAFVEDALGSGYQVFASPMFAGDLHYLAPHLATRPVDLYVNDEPVTEFLLPQTR